MLHNRPPLRLVLFVAAAVGGLLFLVLNTAPLIGIVLGWPGPIDIVTLVAACVLVVLANVARSVRTQLVLDQARRGDLRHQFDALSVGVLFNILLPFRAGEVVRAYVLARRLRISLLYTAAAIVLERLLDILVISGALIVFGSAIGVPFAVVGPAVPVFLVTIGLLLVFVLLLRENSVLMRLLFSVSSLLAPGLRARTRMSLWSLVHGFQAFLRSRTRMGLYGGAFVLSWAGYLMAVLIVLRGVLPDHAVDRAGAGVLVPFAFPETLLGLPSVSGYAESMTGYLRAADVVVAAAWLVPAGILIWVVLNLPTALYGLVCMTRRGFLRRVGEGAAGGQSSGLDRTRRRDAELAGFLDSYFRRDGLALVLHRLEVRGSLEVIRYFKGGSDAVTALVRDDGEVRVRKIVPERFRNKLAQQYQWLDKHSAVPNLVRPLAEDEGTGFYSFDIAYDPKTVPLFDYVHATTREASEAALLAAWDTLFDYVYDLQPESCHPEALETYIEDRLVSRLAAAQKKHPQLDQVLRCETVVIAGVEHPNLPQLLDTITSTPDAFADLTRYRESVAVHGDLTVDNILVDPATGRVLIIDPSDDNQVRGPVVDFARSFQSLWGGYEFLNQIENAPRVSFEGSRAEIVFESYRSARYQELGEWSLALAEERLTPSEFRSLPFHVGLLYGRMLSHRVVIEPKTALIYYARSVEYLHQFIAQYAPHTTKTSQ